MPVYAAPVLVGSVPVAGRGILLAFALLLAACATTGPSPGALSSYPPLAIDGEEITLDQVASRAPTPDLLAVDDDMADFVQRYADGVAQKRQRLLSLHRAVSGRATLGIDYDPQAEGTASEAFHRQSANCLAYSNLFVALAREAGLDARYQWVDVRPQWTRMGERVAVRLHVNAVVHLSRSDRFMVDLDPLPARDITGSQEISDTDAEALYHNNVAMNALAEERLDEAWVHAVRALQLSPGMSHLWVNLGVVYRWAGQSRAAESAYLQALDIDAYERSAMNNLMVLYEMEGNEEEHAYWAARVERYRDSNPYYHAWLGDQAAEEGDWRAALGHYQEALSLAPEDSSLLFSVGVIYRELGERKAALRYLGKARDHAVVVSERRQYQAAYDELNQELLVAQ